MEEIINTASATYRYTTGSLSVIKSVATHNAVIKLRCLPRPPDLHLAAMTACAQCCRPFWLAVAIENTTDAPLNLALSADFTKDFDALPEIFVNGAPMFGDIKRGITLAIGPCQTIEIVYGAVFPCERCFCKCFGCGCDCVSGAVKLCYMSICPPAPPQYVFSNPVRFRLNQQ